MEAQQHGDQLKRGLKNRHIQLIALGGAIGTGLFLGSASVIQSAGPGIILGYAIAGFIAFLIMRQLGHPTAAMVIGVIAIIALPTVLLAFLYGQSRIFFVMSRDGLLPRGLSKVNARTGTPVATTLFTAVVVSALAIHMFVTYSLAIKFIGGRSPLEFFKGAQEATVMAFSTASSNATLPTALRVADQMGLPQRVSRFVLTVGATANQNGTALFEGVTVIFLAQFFGVDLSIGQQFMVMAVCILGGIGTAGVPSGSLPVVAMICAMVGVNPLGIGLILGVNHFLDMCRTALNVTGDLALTTLVAKGESHDGPALAPHQD